MIKNKTKSLQKSVQNNERKKIIYKIVKVKKKQTNKEYLFVVYTFIVDTQTAQVHKALKIHLN